VEVRRDKKSSLIIIGRSGEHKSEARIASDEGTIEVRTGDLSGVKSEW
jgi:hypothetical protein